MSLAFQLDIKSSGVFTLLLLPLLATAQLKEFEVSEMERPDVAVVQANAQWPDDAMLFVYSSLKDLNFRSSLGGIDKVNYNTQSNRYEVLFKPKKQMLFVYANNFVEQKIATINPNPKDVFYYKVEQKQQAVISTEPGTLKIITEPSGADILINGIKTEDGTPFSGKLNPGLTQIQLKKAQYKLLDTLIRIQGNVTTDLKVKLKPSAPWLSKSSSTVESSSVESGDTLYTDAYPAGIISNNYEEGRISYVVYPVENPGYRIKFAKKELSRIVKSNGETYLNPKYDEEFYLKSGHKKFGMVVLPTVPETGKIRFEDVIPNESVSKDDLYASLLKLSDELNYKGDSYSAVFDNYTLAESISQIRLLSERPTTKDYLSYELNLNASYAGDVTRIVGTLKLYFKDGRMRYVLSDFNVFIAIRGIEKKLERYYPGSRGDVKKFWIPIYNGINSTIDLVEYLALNPIVTEDVKSEDDW